MQKQINPCHINQHSDHFEPALALQNSAPGMLSIVSMFARIKGMLISPKPDVLPAKNEQKEQRYVTVVSHA